MRIILVLSAILLAGCVPQELQPVNGNNMSPEMARKIVEKAIEVDSLAEFAEPAATALAPISPNHYDPVSEAVAQMADQMVLGLRQNRVKRLPVAVMPFKPLRNSVRDGLFGERISESFVFPMQQRGYNLVDYRAVSLATTAKGAVSKGSLPALQQQFKIYYILTGTYARHNDGIVLNARVLDTVTRQVVAAGQSHISNARLEGFLPGYDPIKAMSNGYIIENGAGPAGIN